MPRDPRLLAKLAVMGILYVAIPFSLITWAEQSIDSALAAILQGLTPLFALVIAAIVLHDEPITVNKVGGLVARLRRRRRHPRPAPGADRRRRPERRADGRARARALVPLLRGRCHVPAARHRHPTLVDDPETGPRALRPVEIALPQNVIALAIIAVPAILLESGSGVSTPPTANAWLSVIWLGLIGSAIAYLMFYRLLNVWGVYRSSLITYVMPVVGILLGVILLGEAIGIQTLIGTAMVLGGVALANAPIGRRRLYGRRASPVPD